MSAAAAAGTTEGTTAQEDRAAFVPLARELGTRFGGEAARHDRDGSFVSEAYDVLRGAGYLALAVPTELGGLGATIAQVALAQAEMSKHCASTSLAVSMHHHVTLFAAWRYRRQMPGVEALLRRIAEDRIVLVTSGGSDFTRPNGTADRVEGGYRLNGRKIFASQVPAGDVFSTLFTYEDPERGRRVLSLAVPVSAHGVEVIDTWDTLGMRGTGSHDVQITDVFAGDAQVSADRPWGVIDPPLLAIATHAMPVVTGAYLGVAEAARDHAVAGIMGKPRADDPLVQRQVGLMDNKLRVARWALLGALDVIGPDPAPDVQLFAAAMAAKRCVAEEGIAVCDLAMEVAGGSGFYRRNPIEQCYRDIRAIKYHPLTPEQTLLHAGRVALGLPADEL